MLQELVRAFAMLRDSRVRGVLWLGIGLSLATLVALFVGVEALVTLGVGHRLGVARPHLPGAGRAGHRHRRLVPVPEHRGRRLQHLPRARRRRHRGSATTRSLPPPRPLPLTQSVPAALKLLGASLLLNLVALPAYFVPLLNLPVWLALNGYLVGREYAELVASRRLAPAMAARAAPRPSAGVLAGRRGDRLPARGAAPEPGRTRGRRRVHDHALPALLRRGHKRIAGSRLVSYRRNACLGIALTRVRAEPNRAASVDLRPA